MKEPNSDPETFELETRFGSIQAYQWGKKGTPILCIHGFGGSGLDWEIVADHRVGDRKLVALDLPGHGRSYLPESGKGGVEVMVDVLEEFCRCLAFDEVDILAYSMGARIAFHWVLSPAHRIRRLALVGATAGISDANEAEKRLRWDRQLAERARGMSSVEFAELWRNLPIISTQEKIPAPWKSRMRARRCKNRNEALARSLEDMGAGTMPHVWDRLLFLDVPLTLVVGGDDLRYQKIAKSLFEHLPETSRNQILEISGAGHAAHLEMPQRFVEALSVFLSDG